VRHDQGREAAEHDSGLACEAALGELGPGRNDRFLVPVMGGPTAGSVGVDNGERVGLGRNGAGWAEQDVNE
jgi:hypothetical protein